MDVTYDIGILIVFATHSDGDPPYHGAELVTGIFNRVETSDTAHLGAPIRNFMEQRTYGKVYSRQYQVSDGKLHFEVGSQRVLLVEKCWISELYPEKPIPVPGCHLIQVHF